MSSTPGTIKGISQHRTDVFDLVALKLQKYQRVLASETVVATVNGTATGVEDRTMYKSDVDAEIAKMTHVQDRLIAWMAKLSHDDHVPSQLMAWDPARDHNKYLMAVAA